MPTPAASRLTMKMLHDKFVDLENRNRELSNTLERWKLIGSVAGVAVLILFGVQAYGLPAFAKTQVEGEIRVQVPKVVAEEITKRVPDLVRSTLPEQINDLKAARIAREAAEENARNSEIALLRAEDAHKKAKAAFDSLAGKKDLGHITAKSLVIADGPSDAKIILAISKTGDQGVPQTLIQFVGEKDEVNLNLIGRGTKGTIQLQEDTGKLGGAFSGGSVTALNTSINQMNPNEKPSTAFPIPK